MIWTELCKSNKHNLELGHEPGRCYKLGIELELGKCNKLEFELGKCNKLAWH